MSTTASRLGEISLVVVPSNDVDKQIDFDQSLGFEKRTHVPFGGQYRWVEVYPPSGTTGIALAPPPPGGDAGASRRPGTIRVPTDDIDASHAELKANGIDVDAEVSRMGDPVPPMFWFRDTEGNSLLIVQSQSS